MGSENMNADTTVGWGCGQMFLALALVGLFLAPFMMASVWLNTGSYIPLILGVAGGLAVVFWYRRVSNAAHVHNGSQLQLRGEPTEEEDNQSRW